MWTEKKASFVGTYHRVTEAYCEPKPDPFPTIIVGAFGPKLLRLTAKYADWWNVSSTGLVGYRRMVEECERLRRGWPRSRNAATDVGRWAGMVVVAHAGISFLQLDRHIPLVINRASRKSHVANSL
jgi:alkanesulfonate monooxygenase SsuD/methylene tetrahydromethanopterin reductase-like flavin-dependent oxidoreductase (luciferase family)